MVGLVRKEPAEGSGEAEERFINLKEVAEYELSGKKFEYVKNVRDDGIVEFVLDEPSAAIDDAIILMARNAVRTKPKSDVLNAEVRESLRTIHVSAVQMGNYIKTFFKGSIGILLPEEDLMVSEVTKSISGGGNLMLFPPRIPGAVFMRRPSAPSLLTEFRFVTQERARDLKETKGDLVRNRFVRAMRSMKRREIRSLKSAEAVEEMAKQRSLANGVPTHAADLLFRGLRGGVRRVADGEYDMVQIGNGRTKRKRFAWTVDDLSRMGLMRQDRVYKNSPRFTTTWHGYVLLERWAERKDFRRYFDAYVRRNDKTRLALEEMERMKNG